MDDRVGTVAERGVPALVLVVPPRVVYRHDRRARERRAKPVHDADDAAHRLRRVLLDPGDEAVDGIDADEFDGRVADPGLDALDKLLDGGVRPQVGAPNEAHPGASDERVGPLPRSDPLLEPAPPFGGDVDGLALLDLAAEPRRAGLDREQPVEEDE